MSTGHTFHADDRETCVCSHLCISPSGAVANHWESPQYQLHQFSLHWKYVY